MPGMIIVFPYLPRYFLFMYLRDLRRPSEGSLLRVYLWKLFVVITIVFQFIQVNGRYTYPKLVVVGVFKLKKCSFANVASRPSIIGRFRNRNTNNIIRISSVIHVTFAV